ncbi:YiiX/YebB-like N1pC/P60 family cysteine hydrolase [Peredibacter sp. HCB2-198]|uniref:YiiX/YebB-like N1pC/P60 family cysteine hydrolase n=1 Tax=Peredibacter sp. HCB2-198 TaxID=3383025 RepID=UPI0038B61D42
MNKLILALILTIPFSSWAIDLKVGDILLQPLNCWTCSLIEAQEGSIYSHMAVVVQTTPEVKVVEALGAVRVSTLAEFMTHTEKGQKVSHRRFRDQSIVNYLQTYRVEFFRHFQDNFANHPYDRDFLWDNYDENGLEKFYCSELITKFLTSFLGIKLPTKIMKYDVYREHWIRYFNGNPPDGKMGNAPPDYEKSHLFYEVGKL